MIRSSLNKNISVATHSGRRVLEGSNGEGAIESPVVRVDEDNVDRVGVTLAELPGDGVGSVLNPVTLRVQRC